MTGRRGRRRGAARAPSTACARIARPARAPAKKKTREKKKTTKGKKNRKRSSIVYVRARKQARRDGGTLRAPREALAQRRALPRRKTHPLVLPSREKEQRGVLLALRQPPRPHVERELAQHGRPEGRGRKAIARRATRRGEPAQLLANAERGVAPERAAPRLVLALVRRRKPPRVDFVAEFSLFTVKYVRGSESNCEHDSREI